MIFVRFLLFFFYIFNLPCCLKSEVRLFSPPCRIWLGSRSEWSMSLFVLHYSTHTFQKFAHLKLSTFVLEGLGEGGAKKVVGRLKACSLTWNKKNCFQHSDRLTRRIWVIFWPFLHLNEGCIKIFLCKVYEFIQF